MLAAQFVGDKRHHSNHNKEQDIWSFHEGFHGYVNKSWNMGDNAVFKGIIEESFQRKTTGGNRLKVFKKKICYRVTSTKALTVCTSSKYHDIKMVHPNVNGVPL